MSDTVLFIISFIAGINLLLIAVYGWIIKRNEKPFFWLSCMAFSAAIAIINNVLIFNKTGNVFLHHFSMIINLAWGAYFYFLITRLKKSKPSKYRYVLFLPSVLYLFYGFSTFFIPGYNQNLLHKFYVNELDIFNVMANFFIVIYSVGMNFTLLVFEIKTKKEEPKVKDVFKKNRIEILITMLLLQLGTFIPYFINPTVIILVLFMPIATMIFYFWMFLRMHQIMKTVATLNLENHQINKLFTAKYRNFKIDDTQKDEIAKQILLFFEKNKPYLEEKYCINNLSKSLNVSTHIISMVINSNFQTNFPDFLNKYRIEKAIKMLNSNKNYKIEAIAYECGFGNKASFYKIFKKHKGTTPNNYKKEQLKSSLL